MTRRFVGTSVVLVLTAFTMAGRASAQTGGTYDLSWSTIDSGGGTSTGGTYSLSGTIGQPDAGTASGAAYELIGGFWGAFAPAGIPCATNLDCVLADDELGEPCRCNVCPAGFCSSSPIEFGNVNCAGPVNVVNLDDILCVLAGFGNFAACPNADIAPTVGMNACKGNDVINLDDILAILSAFGGADPCDCTP